MAHLSRTDLNLFVVFEAIYSQGGVSRAADQLNLSQPAISHALARLRERVQDPLFVRQGQKLVPTPAAHSMIGPVREGLRLFSQTLGTLDGFDQAKAEMQFTIGMRSLMEASYFVPMTMVAKEQAPLVTLSSISFDRARMGTALASGEMNAVIDVFLPLQDGIRREHLATERSVVVARQGHPEIDGKVGLKEYLDASHVCVTSRPNGLGPEDISLARLGRTRDIAVRCQQVNTAMRLVSMSNLILTMSETFARRANIWFDHQILAAPFEAAPVDIYMYWHANVESDPANIWIRSMVRAAMD